jgi:hypothetical protein
MKITPWLEGKKCCHPEAIRPGWLKDLCANFAREFRAPATHRLAQFAHLIYLFTGEIH